MILYYSLNSYTRARWYAQSDHKDGSKYRCIILGAYISDGAQPGGRKFYRGIANNSTLNEKVVHNVNYSYNVKLFCIVDGSVFFNIL